MLDEARESDDEYEELTGELPQYHDVDHPQLALAGTRALRVALERSAENACQVQDFWDVFQDFVCRHEHGTFVDALVRGLESEVREAIVLERTDELRAAIVIELRDEIRKECEGAVWEDVTNDLREEIEEQVRAKLIREVEPELRKALRATIIEEIRPEVEVKLRGELMVSADFIASVKADLQRKMLGL
jgi:hypothetical protein